MRSVCFLVLAATLAGCASGGNMVLKDETAATVEQKIIKGTSTQADVRAVYGDPSTTSFTDNGNEIWNYGYARATVKAEALIPIVNMFGSGTNVNKKMLVILFDKKGIVINFTISSSKQETKTGVFAN